MRTLGRFRVIRNGFEVPPDAWKRRKARELLWLLCAKSGRPVSRELATGLLWPDSPPYPAGTGRLRVTLHALNDTLEPDRRPHAPTRFVRATAESIRLDPSVWLDLEEFHRLARLAGAQPDPARALGLSRAAVELYSGQFLAEAAQLEWARPARDAAQAAYLDLAIHCGRSELAAGFALRAAELARSVLDADPYREAAYRLLAEAYLATGDPAAARAVFATCRDRLAADLGVDPSWTVDALPEAR